MSGRTTLAAALTMASLLAAPLAAQQRRPPGPGMERAELEARVQQRFAEMVRVQLGLEEGSVRALGEVVRSFQEERRSLLQRERRLRTRLGQAPGGGRARQAPLLAEPEARAVLREMAALRVAEAELYRREQERLLEVLSPGQLVRFYVLREEMAQRLGRFRGGGPGGGGPPGGGPGPESARPPRGGGGPGARR